MIRLGVHNADTAQHKTTLYVKAKFHYASWFGASSELASVMEFGVNTFHHNRNYGRQVVKII